MERQLSEKSQATYEADPQQAGIQAVLKVNGEVVLTYSESTETIRPRFEYRSVQECLQVLDVAGIGSYWLSYSPIGTSVSLQKMVSSSNYGESKNWLESVAQRDVARVVLVPDTNIVINRYVSKVLRSILQESFFATFELRIPRTVILEIERQGNSEEKNFKKRKVIFSWSEILWMLGGGASLMEDLDQETLEGFSSLAGKKFADALIRKEIRNYVSSTQDATTRIVFVTSDLINAFAASAEKLNTLYVSRAQISEYSCDLGKFADVIIAATVLWERVELEFTRPAGASLTLSGLWEGKSIADWRSDLIQVLD